MVLSRIWNADKSWLGKDLFPPINLDFVRDAFDSDLC